jgi:hypothetical protein
LRVKCLHDNDPSRGTYRILTRADQQGMEGFRREAHKKKDP